MPKAKVHKPLRWISRNVYFPPQAGSLAGEAIGPYMLDFQRDFIKEILSKEGEVLKFGFIYGMRKISKTFLYTAIVWYIVNDLRRRGIELPIVSSVYEQGKILYNQILAQVQTEELKEMYKIRKDYFLNKENNSKLHVVFNASTSNLGLQSGGGVFDEVGAFKSSENLETIQSGVVLGEGRPLLLYSSNPPETPDHFVFPMLRAAEKDPLFAVRKYAVPLDKDWQSEKVWIEYNPFLKEWKRTKGKRFQNVMDNYRMLFRRSLETKDAEMSFRRLQLGQSISSNALGYIPDEKIKSVNNFSYKEPGVRWACGIDLSISHDFSCVSFLGWRERTDEIFLKSFLYLPNTHRRRPTQTRQFIKWADAGFISLQDKEVLDPNEIFDDVHKFLQETNIKLEGVQIDPHLASQFTEFFEKNFKVAKQKMTGHEMTKSIRLMERIGNSEGLRLIGENPAVRWQFSNVICSQKSKNYVLMNRLTDDSNIDAPVSASLGLKYLLDNPHKSPLIGAFG